MAAAIINKGYGKFLTKRNPLILFAKEAKK